MNPYILSYLLPSKQILGINVPDKSCQLRVVYYVAIGESRDREPWPVRNVCSWYAVNMLCASRELISAPNKKLYDNLYQETVYIYSYQLYDTCYVNFGLFLSIVYGVYQHYHHHH